MGRQRRGRTIPLTTGMHWIIDRNNAKVWSDRWISELERRALPYDIVRVRPYTTLTVPKVEVDGKVICLGVMVAHSDLARVAAAKGWSPGMWTKGMDARIWNDQLGSAMLNFGGRFTTLGRVREVTEDDLRDDVDAVFVRPVQGNKVFNAGVLTREAIRSLDKEFWKLRPLSGLTADTEILVAPVVNIEAEFRFFVVRGRLVTWSPWSPFTRNDSRNWRDEVGDDVIAFAKSIAERWGPDDAYVMDLARSGGSLKVVEFNCLNSSGLFGCDAGALVDALEEAFG